jgi:hypothetical protein
MRKRREIATLSSSRGNGGWRDGLSTLLHLGCLAIVGTLTIYVFFSVAFDFLVHPEDVNASAAVARNPLGEALLAVSPPPASIPGVRADMQPRPQTTQPGTSGEPQQLAKPLVLTAALAPPPEPRRFDVDQNLAANPPENASAEVVAGAVTEIRDAMTWVIGGRIVHLWGIRSTSRTPTSSPVRFADRMKAESPISCHRQPHSTRYRCFTASREDIAEMALLSGIGQPAIGAPMAYRAAAVLTRGKGSKH